MKKKLFLLFSLILLIFTSLSAQKIEYNKKKGLMSIDKVEVAKLEISRDAEKHQVYTFSDLKTGATLVLTGATPGRQPEYYIVSSTLSDKKSEMLFEMVSFTLNLTNAMMNLVVKKYNFFTVSGINEKAISDFLYLEKKNISGAKEEFANLAEQMRQKIDSVNPVFEGNRVSSKNTGELLVVFERFPEGFLVYNERNQVVGKLRESVYAGISTTSKYVLETFDGKNYAIRVDQPEAAKTAAINCLITYDYLGKGANSYSVKKPQLEALESEYNQKRIEFNKGKNVYGEMILNNGKTLTGKFKVNFRGVLPDGTEYPLDDMGIMSSLQKNAEHQSFDEKSGKLRWKSYIEKEIKSFSVKDPNNPNYEEFYCKIEYKPENPEATGLTGGISRLAGMRRILVYRVSDLPKTILYAGNERFFIVDKKTGGTLKELHPKTFHDQLKLLVADCPSLAEKAASCEYTRASIAQLVKEYNDCE